MKYLSKKEMAKALDISVRHLETLMDRKKLPYIRLSPNVVRFDERLVTAALEKMTTRTITL